MKNKNSAEPMNSSRACFERGISFSKQGNWHDAIIEFEKATIADSSFAEAYCELGCSIAQVGDPEKAIFHLKASIRLDSKIARAHHRLGDLLQRQGFLGDAITAYENSIELNPDNAWSFFNMGTALEKQSRYEDAKEAYQRATELNQSFAEAYCNLGYVLTKQGKLKEAIKSYNLASDSYLKEHQPHLLRQKGSETEPVKPRFFILGCMKSGTTSLYQYISQHPKFLPSIRKEIDFFSLRYSNGLDWYLAHFPRPSEGTGYFTGEASTSYIDYPNVASRLYDDFPSAKLIVIIRDPVDRAFSHYHHVRKFHPGQENRSFQEAVIEEMEFLKSVKDSELSNIVIDSSFSILRRGYLYRGLYSHFIQRWLDVFSSDQLLILKSEPFYSDTQQTMKKVFEFLGVDPYVADNYPATNVGNYSTSIDKQLRDKINDFFKSYSR